MPGVYFYLLTLRIALASCTKIFNNNIDNNYDLPY